ncbi:unnamed protein product, partial [marine sediment metagenome]
MLDIIDIQYQKIKRTKKELIKHLNTFSLNLKISIGIWYFAPAGVRFHEAYVPNKNIAERLGIAYEMAKYGVKAIEAHYPEEVNEENYYLYQKLERETGIKLLSCYPSIFYSRDYEFGSLSNPYNKYRDKAVKILINCLKFVKDKGLHHAGIWPGS